MTEEAQVIGIAIKEEKKGDIIPPGAPLPEALPAYYDLNYGTDPVEIKYDSTQFAYGLHCKIFNPGYPYIFLSATMFFGDTIKVDTEIVPVEDVWRKLTYPEVCDKTERDKFCKKHFQKVIAVFPGQGNKKYFYYRNLLFDYHHPEFYSDKRPLSISLRVGMGKTDNKIDNLLPEQRFTWNIKEYIGSK